MTRPRLILIHGMPATGKTTLARRLAKDMHLPQIGKDDIKELLFDRMGTGDREWSRMQGMAASEMLYSLIEVLLKAGQSLIVESAFYYDLTHQRMADLVQDYNAVCTEIYCITEQSERMRRFVERNESGQRHAGHIDAINYNASDEATDKQRYAPLRIGKFLQIDTMQFADTEYSQLLAKLRR